jgi:hypothetical protein
MPLSEKAAMLRNLTRTRAYLGVVLLGTAVLLTTSLAALLLPNALEESPENQDEPLYYATQKGAKWVYESDGRERIEIIQAAKKRGDGIEITIGIVKGEETRTVSKLLISKRGICGLEYVGLDELKEPHWLLRQPLRSNQEWETVLSAPQGIWKGFSKASGLEDIKVPAGVFKAVCVTYIGNGPGQEKVTSKQWFVKEIGVVKRIHGDAVTVLNAFSYPK